MKSLLLSSFFFLTSILSFSQKAMKTQITKWQYGKKAAVTLTFDDGSINQFRYAIPIMNRLNLPATFFIITGQIPGSQYQGKFIGRPVEQIIGETAVTATDENNFFERASAIGFLGYMGTLQFHTKAGGLYDAGREKEAFAVMDTAYAKVRNGEFKSRDNQDSRGGVTWDEIRAFASQGHEFASHTVTHPYLCTLDEVNMLYELEKSKEEIGNQLGVRYTFSAEGPYGTEHKRAMEYILKVYPATRNRMPESFLEEIDRAGKMSPGTSKKEYVQWQRGATTKTPLPLMQSWVDTVAAHDNNWLVLVFHGVDGIGYEALPHEMLDKYFQYIKQKDNILWVATFADVTQYMRERMSAVVKENETKDKITITLSHPLDKSLYNLPLTLKTYIPAKWKTVKVVQGGKEENVGVVRDDTGTFVQYPVFPNAAPVEISGR